MNKFVVGCSIVLLIIAVIILLIAVFTRDYNNWYMFICIACAAIGVIGFIAGLVVDRPKTYEELKEIYPDAPEVPNYSKDTTPF